MKIWPLLILLLSVSQTAALEITDYTIDVSLKGAVIHEKIVINILNTNNFSIEHFSYTLGREIENLRVYDNAGELKSGITGKGIALSSKFREPLKPGAERTITIEFDAMGHITEYKEFNQFSIVFYLPRNTKKFNLRVELPEGAMLTKSIDSEATATDIVPLPDKTYSDGRRIIFEWNREGISVFSIFLKYSTPKSALPLHLYIPLALIIFGIAIAAFLYKEKREIDKIEYLKEDEQLVINEIRKNEGIDQKKIQQITNFSKAKVSKIIFDLEKRNIVRKEKIGRRNKLYLTEEFKKS